VSQLPTCGEQARLALPKNNDTIPNNVDWKTCHLHQKLFYCFLALIIWIPLPLGSRHPAMQTLMILLINLLFVAYWASLYTGKLEKISRAAKKTRVIYILFALNIFWLWLQSLALPVEWITTLSPERIKFLTQDVNTTTLAINPSLIPTEIMLTVAYAQLFFLTTALVTNKKQLEQLFLCLVICGALQALYGSAMVLSGTELQLWFEKDRYFGDATGTLKSRNHMANYLAYCMAAGIAILLARRESSEAQTVRQQLRRLSSWFLGIKGFTRISLCMIVTGLILTHSRLGNGAFFFSLPLAGIIWIILSRSFSRNILILFGSLLLIDALLLGYWFGLEELSDRLGATQLTTELRNEITPYLIIMTKAFWLSGVGAGGFDALFPTYNQIPLWAHYNEAHNDYLQFAIEQGLIGFTPLICIALLSLFKNIHTLVVRRSRKLQAMCFAVLLALMTTGIHITAEYNLQAPATSSLFVIFLALPWVADNIKSRKRRSTKNNPPEIRSA
jgi:O-antigen ligase